MVTPLSQSRRHGQRGAAIFIVVLVLALLTAMGVFAVRAGSVSELAAGYDRQNTQNHYVAEYGMLGAMTELGTGRRNAYLRLMRSGQDTCAATRAVVASVDGGVIPCTHLYANEVQRSVQTKFSGRTLFDPYAGDGGTTTPGSLGNADLTGDFVVELSEPSDVPGGVEGTDVGGTGSGFKYVRVTLTATGQVRPTCSTTSCQEATATVAGNETGRAFVVVGPVPK